MAISRVTSQDNHGSVTTGNTVTVAWPATPTAGDLLVAFIRGIGATGFNTLSATGFTQLAILTPTNAPIGIFYKLAIGNEVNVVATTSNNSTGGQVAISEFTGNANPIVTDGTAGGTQGALNATSVATPAITTTDPNDLILTFAYQSRGTTAGDAWVTASKFNESNPSGTMFLGQYFPGTTLSGFSDTASWTGTAGSSFAFISAFKAAPPSTPGAVSFARAPTVMVMR